jgi:diguanylate cyclase (GGDEF)-like protein/PAS domain S-box-containing protein
MRISEDVEMDGESHRLPQRTSFYQWLAWGILVLGVATTAFAWLEASERIRHESDTSLDELGGRTASVIEERFGRYVDLMSSFQSVLHTMPNATRRDFHQHFVGMNAVSRYPGIQAIQYASLINVRQAENLEAIVRADNSLQADGYPNFAVSRSDAADPLLPIVYIEPMAGHEALLGTNQWADPQDQALSQRARLTGEVVLSVPKPLPQGGQGVTMIMPVYRAGSWPQNDQQRLDAYVGQLSGVFRTLNFMQEVLPVDLGTFRVRIYDIGSIEALPDEEAVRQVLYDSTSAGAKFPLVSEDVRDHILPLAGRLWSVQVARASVDYRWQSLPVSILFGGLFASFALFAVLLTLANRYQEAARIAHEMGREARSTAARLKSLIDSTVDGIVTVDADGTVTSANPAILRMLNAQEGDVLHRPLSDFVLDGKRILGEVLETHCTVHETVAKGVGGASAPVDVSFSMMTLAGEREVVAILRDASARRRKEERIRHQAYHDALTGLPNRTLLMDRLRVAFDRASRERKPMAVLYVDLDRFKEVNDTLGHDVGDAVLCAVAKRLEESVRAADTVARFGGDEFVVLLPLLTETDDCAVVAEKMLEALGQAIVVGSTRIQMSPSIGGAVYPDDADSIERLLRRADAAMYQAKLSGRNTFRRYRRPPVGDSMAAPLDMDPGAQGEPE